jgi:hypothetical protein
MGTASIVNDAGREQFETRPISYDDAYPRQTKGCNYKVANTAHFWNNDSQRNGGERKCRDRAGD